MSDIESKPFKRIKPLENFPGFRSNDKGGDENLSEEDRKKLCRVFGTKWNGKATKTIEEIFPDAATTESSCRPRNDQDPDYVLEEKFDGANFRYCLEPETGTVHFRSRNKVLKTDEDKKAFFNCAETLNHNEPYLKGVIARARKEGLIPQDAKMIYLTCEMVGGKVSLKDIGYWKSKDSPMKLIPIDLSYEESTTARTKDKSDCSEISVPYTKFWWDIGMKGFEFEQKAPYPLMVTKNLGRALRYIVSTKTEKSKLVDLIENIQHSESGQRTKEGIVMRIIKKDDPNEMYKYLYSSGIAVGKFKSEMEEVVENLFTHYGSKLSEKDLEEMAKEAKALFLADLENNPLLSHSFEKIISEKMKTQNCDS